MVEYVCLECGENLEHKISCVKHNHETKHSNFNIPGADIKFTLVLK